MELDWGLCKAMPPDYVNACTSNGETMLHLAAWNNQYNTVSMLLHGNVVQEKELGAIEESKDDYLSADKAAGEQAHFPWHTAVQKNKCTALRGLTEMDLALQQDHFRVARLLARNGFHCLIQAGVRARLLLEQVSGGGCRLGQGGVEDGHL